MVVMDGDDDGDAVDDNDDNGGMDKVVMMEIVMVVMMGMTMMVAMKPLMVVMVVMVMVVVMVMRMMVAMRLPMGSYGIPTGFLDRPTARDYKSFVVGLSRPALSLLSRPLLIHIGILGDSYRNPKGYIYDSYGFLWVSMGPMGSYGFLWVPMGSYGFYGRINF